MRQGFVSDSFSRQLCSRIVDIYMAWYNYLHRLILPSPKSMIGIVESKIFTKEEKDEMTKLISEIVTLVSKNHLINITMNKKDEAELIDDSLNFWNSTFKPKIIKIVKKVNDKWKEG